MPVPPSYETPGVIYLILDAKLIKTELKPFIHIGGEAASLSCCVS